MKGNISPKCRGSGSAFNMTMRILVIDRNADVRAVLSTLLTAHGHEVFEASDDDSGDRIARTSAPEFVLVNLRQVLEPRKQFHHESAFARVPTVAYALVADKRLLRRAREAGLSV